MPYLQLSQDIPPQCWLATVRYKRRGLWFEYVAALSWAAKAIGGEADVDRAHRDQVVDHVVGLLRRPTLTVDGGRGDLVRERLGQPRRARDVARLLAGLGDTPADDLTDRRRIDAGSGISTLGCSSGGFEPPESLFVHN